MRRFIFLSCISLFGLISCLSNDVVLTAENTIKMSECKEIVVEMQVGDTQWEDFFYLTTMERLHKLYKKEELAYIGSDDNYHFFYWYLKVQYYEDQPRGFAVLKEEYTPKKEFDVKEYKIGEYIFVAASSGK